MEKSGRKGQVERWRRQSTTERQGSVRSLFGPFHCSIFHTVSSPAGTPTTPTATNVVRTSKSDGVKGGTGDSTRDKCVELLYDGLACDANARKSTFP